MNNMDTQYQDQTLTCMEPNCKQEFVFTAGEQRFFAEKGFTPPKRCKPCRDVKRQEKQQRAAQGNGNGNGNGGRQDFNDPSFWTRDEDRGNRRESDGPRRKRRR